MKFALLAPVDFKRSRIAVIVASLGILGGCAITPTPLKTSEVNKRVLDDQLQLYVEQEQVFKPISFEEAVARALKYNLDHRLKLMESALAMGLADLSRYDMLPNLMVSAGYVTRNNDSGGNSVNIDTGQVQLQNSTSQERNRALASADFSWNILDFGVSYYRAKQQADQFLIAEERRRRVIQNILQDTRSAYWRAVGAQRLARDAEALGTKVRSALERSREAEAQGLLPPRDALGYQRLLLDAVSLLAARRQELEFAKRELGALMNLTPGTEYSVTEPKEPELQPVPFNVAELEEVALSNRPELREEDFRSRITTADARRQLLSLMPGLGITAGAQYDSNQYLYNNSWIDSGVRVSFNLMKALSYPAMKTVNEAQVTNDQARRLALSMAVLTQVRVSIERYRLTLQELETARESSMVDQRLASYARAAASTRAESELELVRAETRALNSEYQRYSAYAAAQSAFGRIYNSLGLEVVPANLESDSLANLAEKVVANIAMIEGETFPRLAPVTNSARVMRLQIILPTGRGDSNDVAALRKAVTKALERNQLTVLASQQSGTPELVMQLFQEPAKDGVRRSYWELTLNSADGKKSAGTRYASTLTDAGGKTGLTAFAEAAVIANIKNIPVWLDGPTQKQ